MSRIFFILLLLCHVFVLCVQVGSPQDVVPLNQITHTAVQSGSWSSTSTWQGGVLPNTSARVHIPSGIDVAIRSEISTRIKTIRLEGKLSFATDVTTKLNVETIIGLMNSELEIGTIDNPVDAAVTAQIQFIDEGPLDLNTDYGQYGKGLITMGTVRMHGAEKSTWMALPQGVTVGDQQVDIGILPNNWNSGDELVISTSSRLHPDRDEKRSISQPNGSTAAIVKGCVIEDDPGWAYVNHSSNVDFVDNVSYNVVGGAFQTESGDEIGAFRQNLALRTINPDYPILDPNTADVDVREESQDFAFQGDAFWFHGGGVEIEGNVAAGCSGHGFIFWTEGLREVGTAYDLQNMFEVVNLPKGNLLPGVNRVQSWWVPVRKFKDNTAYCATNGFAAYYVHATLFEDITELSTAYLNTVHSTFENTKIWNVLERGVELQNCERFTFKNLELVNDGHAIGIDCKQTVASRSIWNQLKVEGFEEGMIPPMQGEVSICDVQFSNLLDFQLFPPQRDSRHPGQARDLSIEQASFPTSPYFSSVTHYQMEGAAVLDGAYPWMLDPEFAHKYFLIPDRIVE